MKLTIKHLAPYLPYGLKCYVDEYGIELIIGATNDEVITTEDSSAIDSIKPILRPLSDLTKEIEVDGEKIIPLIKFAQENIHEDEWNRLYVSSDGKTFFNCLYNTGGDEDDLIVYLDKSGILLAPYERIIELLEWHFDVFGLIEKDLAIDINTLTPTK